MTARFDETRRQLLVTGGLSVSAALCASYAGAQPPPAASAVDEGSAAAGQVTFPPIHASSEPPDAPPPQPDVPGRRIGIAVMGLGRLALANILPAFSQCRHARLTALISGSPDKMRTVAAQYGIAPSSCYGYADIAKLRDNPAVQIVYVVLPNALHHDAVLQIAQAGKHVLCEKPMAVNPQEAREMIAACKRAQRKLMIAYRCQYEVNNRELARRARAGEFGDIQLIDTLNTQNQGDPSQWRQIKALAGGGALPDVGLYCLNTARALLGDEPVEVSAVIRSPAEDPRFKEVESNVSFTLRFASGVIANCATSYSVHQHRNIRVLGSKATAEITNAFGYEGQRLHINRREGAGEATTELILGLKNQFSLEMDHMALCVRDDVEPRTPGEEGLQDQVVMAAIYEAAATGQWVKLAPVSRTDAFRGPAPLES
jgi:predicted dehydrogenase